MRTVHGDCERVRQWVSAELDGELSDFERVLITGHVAGCTPCAAFQAEAAGIVHKLRSVPLEPFERRIETTRKRRLSLRLAPAVAAMAVSAVGLGSLLASSQVRPAVGTEAPGEPAGVGSQSSATSGPVSQRVLLALHQQQVRPVETSTQRSIRAVIKLQ